MPLPILPLSSADLAAGQSALERLAGGAAGATRQLAARAGSTGGQVLGALRTAASATGVNFEVLATKAAMESGFRPTAQASTSSARGLFQFIDQTWLDMVQRHGAEHGLGAEAAAIRPVGGGRLSVADPAERSRILALRDNPELSARLAGEYLKEVSDKLTPVLGRRPDAAELYMGHFLGTGGATQMLRHLGSDPGRAAAEILPAAAAANPSMFKGADGRPLTVAQFADRIRERLNKTYAELGLSPPDGAMTFQPNTPAVMGQEPGLWNSSTPVRTAHAPERAMVSALVEVFSRMGRVTIGQGARGAEEAKPNTGHGSGTALPAAVVAAMRDR